MPQSKPPPDLLSKPLLPPAAEAVDGGEGMAGGRQLVTASMADCTGARRSSTVWIVPLIGSIIPLNAPMMASRMPFQRSVAVVLMASQTPLSQSVNCVSAPSAVSRMLCQAAAAVSHPGIATVYAFLETADGNFIASEFIHGRTLRQELQHGAVEPARAVRLAAEIARALCAAHDAHVVHRDLKPENILLTESGAIKVIDFGIARIDRHDLPSLTRTGLLQGTPGYMAPEQFVSGAQVDARVDVYALGVILTEMLLGHHPFEAGQRILPSQVQPIARRCLESDPERRYRTTRDILHDLERASLALEMSESRMVPAVAPRPARAMFWWQFHQALCAVIYWVMAVPAWYTRETVGGSTGRTLFVVTLGALLLASILRLHLWFTSRATPDALLVELKRERPWILMADLVFSAALIVSGVMVGETQVTLSVLLLAVGVGAAVVALFIEPATARAALRDVPNA